MNKDKKEFENNPAALSTPALAQSVNEKIAAGKQPEIQLTFSRYAFDSAGGGYQGL